MSRIRVAMTRAWPVLIPLVPLLLFGGVWWWNVRLTPEERELVGIWTFQVPQTADQNGPLITRYVVLKSNRSIQSGYESQGLLNFSNADGYTWSIQDGHLQIWDTATGHVINRLRRGPVLQEKFRLNTVQPSQINLQLGSQGDVNWYRLAELPAQAE